MEKPKGKFSTPGEKKGLLVKKKEANARSGQPPVESPPGQQPKDKPGEPGEEPKLMPEAESARDGGMMARIPPTPEGVLPETPDPRASYQVKPSDDSSPLIKVGPSAPNPTPGASGIDVGEKTDDKADEADDKPGAIPPKANPSEKTDKEEK